MENQKKFSNILALFYNKLFCIHIYDAYGLVGWKNGWNCYKGVGL